MIARLFKYPVIILTLGILFIAGCSPGNTNTVPSDFLFVLDVKSAGDFEGCPFNVNIRIEFNGKGRYEYYDTGCAIEYDSNHVVTYKPGQVVKSGKLRLDDSELERLWEAINKNNFFNLTDDYCMSMGFSYAFIMVDADGRRHMVDNIGMELPVMRALVETTDAILPEGVKLDYGEGFLPKGTKQAS